MRWLAVVLALATASAVESAPCRLALALALDVSADGKNNDWPTPAQVCERGTIAGLRINALVIVQNLEAERAGAGETGELPAYFNTQVIQGPGAFVEVARGFEDHRRAMTRKLVRELATQPLGHLEDRASGKLRRF